MSTPLNTMKNVNKHCLKALERAGVDTVEKLCAMTMHDLGKVKGIGGTGQVELVWALSEIGLKLRLSPFL